TQGWVPRNMVFASKAAIDRLSAAEKKALIEAAGAAEDRGWKLSIEEMTIKTKALKDAGIIVVLPSSEFQSGLAKTGEVIANEWAASAGADGEAMPATYRKKRATTRKVFARSKHKRYLRLKNLPYARLRRSSAATFMSRRTKFV